MEVALYAPVRGADDPPPRASQPRETAAATWHSNSHISPDMQDTVVSAVNLALDRSQKPQSSRPHPLNYGAPGRIRTCDRRIRSP
jgi:hypothetical protein